MSGFQAKLAESQKMILLFCDRIISTSDELGRKTGEVFQQLASEATQLNGQLVKDGAAAQSVLESALALWKGDLASIENEVCSKTKILR